jgi:tetratricopeptide (TPR) repeat protein
MDSLLIGLVGALMATNQPAALSNLVVQHTGVSVEITDPNDPVEKEFQVVMKQDDDAQEEVDKWIRDNQEFAKQGAGVPAEELNQRILARFEPVRKAYEEFLQRHPDYSRAHLSFASFLDDIGDEDGSVNHMEKARELDPKNPAVWNNLANHYGHSGELKTAFEYYGKAIELNPNEPIYYHNFGTTVFLYRKDAKEFYNITEQQVFDKALDLYTHALKLDPDNFPLASDVAQTYYGIKPLRTNDALLAWTNTLSIAHNEVEREGVYIHLARLKMLFGRFDEATAHLNSVTNENYAELKRRVTRAMDERIAEARQTNAPAAAVKNQ